MLYFINRSHLPNHREEECQLRDLDLILELQDTIGEKVEHLNRALKKILSSCLRTGGSFYQAVFCWLQLHNDKVVQELRGAAKRAGFTNKLESIEFAPTPALYAVSRRVSPQNDEQVRDLHASLSCADILYSANFLHGVGAAA